MTVELTKLHRTRLLPFDVLKDKETDGIRPEFKDLFMTFLRNRVWIEVDLADAEAEEEDRMSHLFESQIVNALENRCKGFWSLDFKEDDRTCKVTMFIMFEYEADLEGFLANEAMMFKLAA